MDDAVFEILETLKNLDLNIKTIIVFMSDHGDMHGEKGIFMRGGPYHETFYDNVMNIPLVIKNPMFSEKKVDALAQTVDIMPTLLDFLDISAEYYKQGKLPAIIENPDVNDYVFAGTISDNRPKEESIFGKIAKNSMIRSQNWKLIERREFGYDDSIDDLSELGKNYYAMYDIKNDSGEINNLAETNPEIFEMIKENLDVWELQFDSGFGFDAFLENANEIN